MYRTGTTSTTLSNGVLVLFFLYDVVQSHADSVDNVASENISTFGKRT